LAFYDFSFISLHLMIELNFDTYFFCTIYFCLLTVIVENVVDNSDESKPANVESSVELKPSMVEASVDMKPNFLKLSLM